jgi:diguanylate cyclase (GGDEF)-like protein/PAS domain S-box-containing protein
MLLGLMVLGGLVYAGLARRFAHRMRAVRQSLSGEGLAQKAELPSSGVSEIDNLCASLSDAQQRLGALAQDREKMLLSAAHAGTYAVRAQDHVVVAADRSFLDMLGMEEGEVVGHPWSNLLAEHGALPSTTQQLEISEVVQRIRKFVNRKGRPLWLSLAEFEQVDEAGEVIRHGLAIDVSERERLLATVRDQTARLQVLWQIATSRTRSEGERVRMMLRLGMDTLDMDAALLSEKVGDRFMLAYLVDTLGMFKAEEVCPLGELCQNAADEDRGLFIADMGASGRPKLAELAAGFGVHAYAGIPLWVGEQFYGTLVFLRKKPLAEGKFSPGDEAFMELLAAWFSQMLLQLKQRQKLETQALTDELTGLPNRRAAELRFDEEIARAKRDGIGFSIATCDLDRFKLINDHYGHGVGDEVLRQVSHIMRLALREGDWLARWGGEEFILFLHHSDRADAVAAAERVRLAIKAHPLDTSQGSMEVTASFGVGVCQAGDENISQALSESDSCLYEAKRKGRDCVIASESGGTGTLWRAGMLQRALKEERIVAAYQIMVDLTTRRPVADEALARMLQTDGPVLGAGEFIEAAEGINLIHEVDRAITSHAMTRCAVNLTAGHDPGFAHFINLSPQFLARKDYVEELLDGAKQFCSACNIDFPGYKPVVFEITERQLMSDFERIRRELQPLLDFGFRLALDDFGSGYSSFLYLAELPVSFLKIEGWMVRNMTSNDRVRAMVESMIVLSKKLNITTIAECIEDRETADMLRDMGVDWGQGYYFGRPEI